MFSYELNKVGLKIHLFVAIPLGNHTHTLCSLYCTRVNTVHWKHLTLSQV